MTEYSAPEAVAPPSAEAHAVSAGPATTVVALSNPTPQALADVERIWEGGARFAALPMLVGDAGDAKRAELAAVEGVVVSHVGDLLEPLRAILVGIDILVAIEVANRSGTNAPYTLGGVDESGNGSPIVVERDGRHLLDVGPRHITRMAHLPAINVSLGPSSAFYPADPRDPINTATFFANRLLLPVFAAGNSRQHPERETMSAWAEMPWVLSVGATDDPAGTIIQPTSSAGIPGIPDSGPVLVGYGRSRLNEEKFGTSFAAPRVTSYAMLFAAVVWQLAAAAFTGDPDEAPGIPLIGTALIDEFRDDRLPMPERLPVPSLPAMGVDAEALRPVIATLAEQGVTTDITVSSDRLRRMLIGSARPIAQYGPHLVGAGFVSQETVMDWLEDFSGAHFAWLFSDRPPASEALRALAEVRLLDREQIELLGQFVDAAAPVLNYDRLTGRLTARRTAES